MRQFLAIVGLSVGLFAALQACTDGASKSSSTDPTASIDASLEVRVDETISNMLGAETAAIQGLSSTRLATIAAHVEEPARPQSAFARFFRWNGTSDEAKEPPFPYDEARLDAMPVAKGDAQWACLTEALYFEARGESVKGQFAVAEVILNRAASPHFPNSICGVVRQGTGGRRYRCQFSYNCDGRAEVMNETRARQRVARVARLMIDGATENLTDGATFYHTVAVNPSWSRVFTRTTTIGVHEFYRDPSRVAQN